MRSRVVVRTFVASIGSLATSATVTADHGHDNMFPTPYTKQVCESGSFDNKNGFCRTDSRGLTAWFNDTLSADDRSGIRSSLDGSFDLTVLDVSYPSSPVFSGSGETDLIYGKGPIAQGFDGVTWCNAALSGSEECDQHYIRFSENVKTVSRALACHETGHGVGLTHGKAAYPMLENYDNSLGCMTDPREFSYLFSHNETIINNTY